MELHIEIAGEEQMPPGTNDSEEVVRLWDSNADTMDDLFRDYFQLDPTDRYMGSLPYSDRETGRPKVRWALSMGSHHTRDAIVACLRAAIQEAGMADIVVLKSDDDPASAHKSLWPAKLQIVAMGPSITDTLVGERRVRAALEQLKLWLTRD